MTLFLSSPDDSANREWIQGRWRRPVAILPPPLVPGLLWSWSPFTNTLRYFQIENEYSDLLLPLPPVHQRVWRPLQSHLVANLNHKENIIFLYSAPQREYYHSIFCPTKWTLSRNVADVTLGWVSWNEPDVSWGIPEGDRASLIGELAHCSFLETIGWGFCKWKRWAMMITEVDMMISF